jgi:hypothetical protein
MPPMPSLKITLIVVGVVLAAAFALHVFGGDLMVSLRALHGR